MPTRSDASGSLRTRFRWVGRLGGSFAGELDLDPPTERLAEASRARVMSRMSPRDRLTSVAIGGGFLGAALAAARLIPSDRSPSAAVVILLVVLCALASRIEFEIGAGSAIPTQLVLVPMLFVLPIGQVPGWVAVGYLLGRAPDCLRGRMHVERLLIPLCGAWHTLGPTLVLGLAGPRAPTWHDTPVYLGALAAQFGFDSGSAALRDRLAHQVDFGMLARYLGWAYLIDLMLAPIGLLIAFAATSQPAAALSALPLIALIWIFARERKARIDHALELGGVYRGTALLAEAYHEILSEQALEPTLDRIEAALSDLIPHDALVLYALGERHGDLAPLRTRGATPYERPERVEITVPLICRGHQEGILSLYRQSSDQPFTEDEVQLARWFGDAAALALDNARIRAKLKREAQTDSLTGLLNHRACHERLQAELGLVHRQKATVALLMLDIDDFKRINDLYSHATGDHVVATLAELLRNSARTEDAVCRVGGEEFAVVMPSSNAPDASALARRLADELSRHHFDSVGTVTISIGIAEAPAHATTASELIDCAEAAMMTAKALGKSRTVIYNAATMQRPTAPGRTTSTDEPAQYDDEFSAYRRSRSPA
jgi:diguanylate cyclase (GGDEF)-like protein